MLFYQDIEMCITAFKNRVKSEPEFCKALYEQATVKIMARKYAYYILSESYISDLAYDISEKDWYIMGRALGILAKDETSPCIDFDFNHPMANKGIELANKLLKRRILV